MNKDSIIRELRLEIKSLRSLVKLQREQIKAMQEHTEAHKFYESVVGKVEHGRGE